MRSDRSLRVSALVLGLVTLLTGAFVLVRHNSAPHGIGGYSSTPLPVGVVFSNPGLGPSAAWLGGALIVIGAALLSGLSGYLLGSRK